MSFLENLSWRYATKKFNGQRLSEDNLNKIKEAIRFAPSSFGVQPYHVVVVEDRAVLQDLKKYAKNNQVKFDTCSHLFIFCLRTDTEKRFQELEKMQNRPKGFLSKVGFVFQHFLPFISLWSMGRFITKDSWARNQAYIALGFALAACAELELDSCPMEGFNTRGFHKILKLPNNIKPTVLMAVGYRAENDVVFTKARFPEKDLFTSI
jgi:nitroreductase